MPNQKRGNMMRAEPYMTIIKNEIMPLQCIPIIRSKRHVNDTLASKVNPTCQSTDRTVQATACLGVICSDNGVTRFNYNASGSEGGPGHPAGTRYTAAKPEPR